MKNLYLFLFVSCLFVANTQAQVEVTTYGFEGLTVGSALNGQDSWKVTSIGQSMNINNQKIINAAPNGAYGGGTAFRGASNGGNRIFRASRVNNGNFSFQNLGCKQSVVLEWDEDPNFWNSSFRLGYDKNGDGDLNESGEPGFGLYIGRGGVNTNPYKIVLYKGNYSTAQQNVPLSYSGFSWYRFRIEIDMTANGGQGSATVSYRDLNNNGPWVQVGSLTNVNMGFDTNANNASNPANLNGYAYTQGADATTLDNITITTDAGPDSDGDGIPDFCDACPNDPGNDADGDGVCGDVDNCPATANADQTNTDGDTEGDACDQDDDNDGFTDECDSEPLVDNYTYTSVNDLPASWRCGNKNRKVLVCHNGNTLCISGSAVQAHLDHGDYLGPCTSCGGQNLAAPSGNGIISTNGAEDHLELEIFPNPANTSVNLHLHGIDNGEAVLSIFDQLGREVFRQDLAEGTHAISLDLMSGEFVAGKYYVMLRTDNQVITKNFTIMR